MTAFSSHSLSSSSTSSSHLRGSEKVVYSYHIDDAADDDPDYRHLSNDSTNNYYRQHSGSHGSNYTFQASVTIRVTPHDDFFVSWGILWGLFVLASLVAAYQVVKEHRILESRRQQGDESEAPGAVSSSGSSVRAIAGDGESVSTADETRALFRRLLLLAMLTRVLVMPIQIWSDPVWCQFFADTLPEMVFASAWTTLVSFLVQLVGLAAGMGTNTSPSVVIQITAYVLYAVLLVTQVWDQVATVLLYALMCCLYAALFGTAAYFCPVLMSLLLQQSSTTTTTGGGNWHHHHQGLTIRLLVTSALLLGVCLAHTIGYARLVVAPPHQVYWWWKYGALELIPSVTFLIMMGPSSSKKAGRAEIGDTPPKGGGSGVRRVDSSSGSVGGGAGGGGMGVGIAAVPRHHRPPSGSGGSGGSHETAALLPKGGGAAVAPTTTASGAYGAASAAASVGAAVGGGRASPAI